MLKLRHLSVRYGIVDIPALQLGELFQRPMMRNFLVIHKALLCIQVALELFAWSLCFMSFSRSTASIMSRKRHKSLAATIRNGAVSARRALRRSFMLNAFESMHSQFYDLATIDNCLASKSFVMLRPRTEIGGRSGNCNRSARQHIFVPMPTWLSMIVVVVDAQRLFR